MSAALNPRRWFRFRLRTVLLLIALLAIPCAWLGSEWKLVRERKALIDRIEAVGGVVWDAGNPNAWMPLNRIVIEPGSRLDQVSKIRRWLGDRDVREVFIQREFLDEDKKRILELFPGTSVIICEDPKAFFVD
jgi:hypothetical protein